jgi:hypothetical protein
MGGKKYLIKLKEYSDLELSHFMQRHCCAAYSNDIGTAIHDKLPHFISKKGDVEHEVISSDSKKFKDILIHSVGELEERIKNISSELKEKMQRRDNIINALYKRDSTKYLVRHEDFYLYLMKGSLGSYTNNPSEGILDEVGNYYHEKLIISSESKQFEEILRKELIGDMRSYGIEGSIKVLENRLCDANLNYNIISEILKTGESNTLKEFDKKHKEAEKVFLGLYKK